MVGISSHRLNALTKVDLQDLCEREGIASSGAKGDLVTRLVRAGVDYDDLANMGQMRAMLAADNIQSPSRGTRGDLIDLLEGPPPREPRAPAPAVGLDDIESRMAGTHIAPKLVPVIGIVYHLPRDGGTGYVGQTKNLPERLRRHQDEGRDVRGVRTLYQGPQLNEHEAYYIGYHNTKEDGSNGNRGNSIVNYIKGQRAGGWA